ncbi:MAG: hypothetical protein RIT45_2058 [Pseudomonadota bacterium]
MSEGSAQTLLLHVEKTLFRSDDGRFGIHACIDADGQKVRIKGPVGGLVEGDDAEVEGVFVEDPRYGKTFRAASARPRLPATREGVARLIAHLGVPGVGPRRAEAVADALGDDPLRVLRESPERMLKVRGLGRATAEVLLETVQARLQSMTDEATLHDLGLGPAAIARLTARYPEGVVLQLRADPYRAIACVPGLGFRTADAVARSLGHGTLSPVRLVAGLRAAAEALSRRGHTAPPEALLVERATELLELAPEQVAEAIPAAEAAGALLSARIDDDAHPQRLGAATLMRAELTLAAALRALARSPARELDSDALQARIALAEAAVGHPLARPQRDAIATSLVASLHVVTGGPGTGKTTIVRGLVAALGADGVRIGLAAPTGRAARRLTEATGSPAQTLHRLLEFEPHKGGFARNAEQPLELDVLIVDEASMIDVPLAHALLAAVPTGARLVLIGDADQLPSVGPGAVLDDLIRAGAAPLSRLHRVYRQGARSGIVDAAHDILEGVSPTGARDERGDFFVILRSDADAVAQTIEEIVAERLPGRFGLDPIDDVAVLVPMHRGPVGTRELNERLGARLNPMGAPLGGGLRAGDKVLQTRNNYDLDVFNGDIGEAKGRSGSDLLVRFGEREVRYPDDAVGELEPAFAMTVHKSQGSEMPAVVVGLEDAHHVLLERNLLYTAVTRARRVAVIVATPRALQRAVHNTAPRWRATLLGAALCGQVHVRGQLLPEGAG